METTDILKDRIAKTDEILDGADVGLSLVNKDMEIIWLNRTMQSWFGPSEQLLGKKCYVCFEHKDAVCENCPVKKAFVDKNPHTNEIRIGFAANGEKRYYKLTATPILDAKGNVEKVLESAVDITEKRRRDIKNRRHFIEMRKLTKEIIKLNKIFKKLADRRSAKLKLANEELKNIYELGNMLITSLDVDEVMRAIVNIVPKLLKVYGCIVRIIDETGTKLRLEAACGVSDEFQERAHLISIGDGISGRVAKAGLHIAIPDILKDERIKYYQECSREGMRSLLAIPIIFKKKTLGVIVAFSRKVKYFSTSEINLLSTFAAHAAIALNNAILHNKVHLNYYNTMITLVKAMEARDPYTRGHSERVTNYAIKIAKKLNLTKDNMQLLLYAGKLHDIGKIAIPDFILKKTAALTPAEKAEIEVHPIKGVEMINELKFLQKCFPLIRHHHERYDGNGYPDRLKGEKIPFLARILSMADAFDAMTSERPYRKGLTIDEGVEEVKRNSNTQFDPQLTQLFLTILQEQPTSKIIKEIPAQPIDLAR